MKASDIAPFQQRPFVGVALRPVILLLFTLAPLATAPIGADAQSCAGFYQVSQSVISAYSNYDRRSSNGTSDTPSKTVLIRRLDEYLDYSHDFYRAADGIDTDQDALLSQCDNDARIAVYKAATEAAVFWARVADTGDKALLDAGAFFLDRLKLVLEKSNRQDSDIVPLADHLKSAYVRAHLSMPEDLTNVGRNGHSAMSTTPNASRAACANPDVAVTVTDAVQPDYPASARDLGFGAVIVNVIATVGPSGNVIAASVYKSSGNMAIDQAALRATRESTYSPALKNCRPTQGDYLFHADFQPD